ncbi:MAG: Gfo/Idh/MocA family oxidoreductase [Capsulimonadaceae bacterium]|nr:Gfo/Idh/MocA family oxidoreductase [Capsulimonadaceae bacterium]
MSSDKTAGPIRLGLLGIGRAGNGMHFGELAGQEDKFRYVACCDLIEQRVADTVARFEGCRGYARYEDMLADENVEIVDIATRSCDHFAHAKLALEAGKSVLIEKPMTCTFDEAKKLVAIAETAPGSLYVRHNRRFEPAFQHIREIIASGILGDVYEIKLRRVGYGRRDDWQTIKEFGGGQLLNWGPHVIDHALRLLESPVKSMWSNLRRIAAVGDAEDHVRFIVTGENGRIVDGGISGGTAIGEPEYLIWGTKGSLSCTGDSITMRYLDPARPPAPRAANPETPTVATFGGADNLHWVNATITASPATGCDTGSTIWEQLYEAFRNGKPFPITLDEAVGVMEIVSAIKRGTEFE